MSADAFIDLKGVWRDENDIWKKWERDPEKALAMLSDPDKDLMAVAEEEFQQVFESMLDSLGPEDYVLLVDGHAFP